MRLIEEAAGRNDHKAAIRCAHRIIDLEPTDEAAVRIQMEAHLALGNRAAALRIPPVRGGARARACGRTGEAIEAVYNSSGLTLDREEAQRKGEDVAPVAESPFVGRELELNQLNEAWNTARGWGISCW